MENQSYWGWCEEKELNHLIYWPVSWMTYTITGLFLELFESALKHWVPGDIVTTPTSREALLIAPPHRPVPAWQYLR